MLLHKAEYCRPDLTRAELWQRFLISLWPG